jgi:hypothetical protein
MLVLIPVFFVLIFASVLGQFAKALGGTMAGEATSAISAGWAAAFLCGALAFFQISSSRGADRRLAAAGLGAARVALARIAAAIVLGVVVSAVAFLTLLVRSGIAHPAHAAAAILAFALVYVGVGALIGSLVAGPLEGSLLVVLVFAVVFVMHAALAGDRRLVLAGFRPGEAVRARLVVLAADAVLVVAVSLLVTAPYFTPASWLPFAAAAALIGLIYAPLGALLGAVLDKLSATYLMLFIVMTDIGIVQNPMFGDGTPGRLAPLLPAYGPTRVMVDGAYSAPFHATGPLLLSLAWAGALLLAVTLLLRRAVATHC